MTTTEVQENSSNFNINKSVNRLHKQIERSKDCEQMIKNTSIRNHNITIVKKQLETTLDLTLDDNPSLSITPKNSCINNLPIPTSLHQQQSSLARNSRFATCINYGFGVPFSYWREWDIYPFITPKYRNLKEELLYNTIYTITFQRYQDIYKRGQDMHPRIAHILGNNDDKNTACAHYRTHWNDYCDIEAGTLISLKHLLSILFYTDSTELTTKMKDVCRKLTYDETVLDVKKRHVEFVHWLKLMTETLIFYGNRLSNKDKPIYHGLKGRFLFDQFKAQFHIPTSTSTERGQANLFAEDGIVLQFGGLESIGDPYFDTKAISAYPHEKEYLFFKTELNITAVFTMNCTKRFSMLPLSLYQSIINGSIINKKSPKSSRKTQESLNSLLDKIDKRKQNNVEEKQNNNIENYGLDILQYFMDKYINIYINHQQIIKKINYKLLRERFIVQDKNKTFCGYSQQLKNLQTYGVIKIHSAETHEWTVGKSEYKQLMKHKVTSSNVLRFGTEDGKENHLVKFYCQLNMKSRPNTKENNDEKEEVVLNHETGSMSLILYQFGKNNPQQKIITISCDLFCKEMDKYYIRFHKQSLILGENQENTRVTAVFEWNKLIKAFEKYNKLHWIISIRKEQTDINDQE